MTFVKANTVESITEGERVRSLLPYCGTCGASVKVQAIAGGIYLLCIVSPSHWGLRDNDKGTGNYWKNEAKRLARYLERTGTDGEDRVDDPDVVPGSV